jgi:UDP-2,3-diacylglucosamine pyrophosphatase LpxH
MRQFNKKIVRIEEFETKIAELAIEKKYHSVICGHIHQPGKRVITTEKGSVTYLNSGDWVEHLTALEYYENDWHVHTYEQASAQAPKVELQKPKPQVMTNEIAMYLHSLNPQSAIV